MPSLVDLRRRIRAVKNTQQITKAMKMVAASKLRRAQERIMSARPYATQMHRVLTSVASRVDPSIHPLLVARERSAGSKTLVIVVTGDKGLCGSFNTNVIKSAAGYITESAESCSLGLVGRKGRDFFGRRGFEVFFEQVGLFQKLRYDDARQIAQIAIDAFTSAAERGEGAPAERVRGVGAPGLSNERGEGVPAERIRGAGASGLGNERGEGIRAERARGVGAPEVSKVDRVVLVYNEFRSVISQRVVVDQLLPIPRAEVDAGAAATDRERPSEAGHTGSEDVDYLYEPSPQEIFNQLLPRHVEVQIYRALLESNAAFFAAQMTAMDTATKNSSDMISSLTLYMNKVRQAAITREIIEVVSGAQAL